MTDKPTNFELDDELLSAYLDGELSAAERATVEARLATDPAAQQLLHELRSVSQSVQALPTESLGRDLSDEIIGRAREAKPELVVHGSPDSAQASNRRSPRSIDALPKIRIFSSKRAWIWASMALAAGVLIMIVQSGDESGKRLPPVAARSQEGAQIQPTDEAAQPSRREISKSAAPPSLSPPPATVASDRELHEKVDALGGAMPAAPISSEPRGVELRSDNEVGAPGGPPGAPSAVPVVRKETEKPTIRLDDSPAALTAAPEQLASDKSTLAPQPTGSLSSESGAPGMSAGKQTSESVASPSTPQFVVVHVVATPDALKKGSFDRLLADNKIEFVPQPAKKQPLSVGGGLLAKPAESESRSKKQSNNAAEFHTSNMEMVLVEAPAPAIESCLSDLSKNANDFVSIAVNDERQSHDRFDANSTVAKSPAETAKNLSRFSRFSRGAAPEAQKDAFDLRKYLYSSDFAKPNDPIVNGAPPAGGFGGEAAKSAAASPDANGVEKWYYKNQSAPDIRRARSIAAWGTEKRESGEVAAVTGRASRIQPQSIQSGAEATNQALSQRNPSARPEAKADNQDNNLKVLFVFTPEETSAPSVPLNDRPK